MINLPPLPEFDCLDLSGEDQCYLPETMRTYGEACARAALEAAARVLDCDWPADSSEERLHRADCAAAVRGLWEPLRSKVGMG